MICPFPSCARLDSTETSCPSRELGWRLMNPIPPSFVLRLSPLHDLPRSSSRGAARRGYTVRVSSLPLSRSSALPAPTGCHFAVRAHRAVSARFGSPAKTWAGSVSAHPARLSVPLAAQARCAQHSICSTTSHSLTLPYRGSSRTCWEPPQPEHRSRHEYDQHGASPTKQQLSHE